ncbi:hypothetical protein GGS20DRAFT_515983 [Poronia punctata]|nr:hypothetical protein GGS20DRAFT_515983 [Poronia punctata]
MNTTQCISQLAEIRRCVGIGTSSQEPELSGPDDVPKPSQTRQLVDEYKLPCIEEHEKESSREYEGVDYGYASHIAKAPLLKPTRVLSYYRQVIGTSCSSDDSIPISPLQLDSEQIWAPESQEQNQDVFSSWHYTVSILSHAPVKQNTSPGICSEEYGAYIPKVVEVQWGSVRWSENQPNKFHLKSHKRTLSGTGFDGPLSSVSVTPSDQSPPDGSSANIEPLTRNKLASSKLRDVKSDTTGSIDWGKSWLRRNPRQKHDVSEVSDGDTSNIDPVATSRASDAESNPYAELRIPTAEVSTGEYEDDQQAQIHTAKDCVLKSCPDLHRPSPPTVAPAIPRSSADRDCGLKSPNYSRFDSSRHRHHLRVPKSVSKHFRSLRERFSRKRSSSLYSLRSEFPPPPHGTQRRILSRNSSNIVSSSGEETPLFNTPESDITPMKLDGHCVNPLGANGLLIATAELDRLSGSSYEVDAAKLGVTGSRPPRHISDSSGSGERNTELASPSHSSVSDPTGSSSGWPYRLARPGIRRQHSRLSEVTTPDEVDTPIQVGSGRGGLTSPHYLSRRPVLGESHSEPLVRVVPPPEETPPGRMVRDHTFSYPDRDSDMKAHDIGSSRLLSSSRPRVKSSRIDPSPQQSLPSRMGVMSPSTEKADPFSDVYGVI